MTGWYKRRLNQSATRWVPSETLNSWGKPSSFSRTVLSPGNGVRWDETRERFIDREGRDTFSSAIVFLNQDVSEGDYLYLGIATAGDPASFTGAYIVRRFESTPSLAGRSDDVNVRRAFL